MVFERPKYEQASSSEIGEVAGLLNNGYGNNTNAARRIFEYRVGKIKRGIGDNVKSHVDAPPPEDKFLF